MVILRCLGLNRLAKDFGLAFNMHSIQQFSQRFSNDLETIREVGFEIEIQQGRSNMRTYDIRWVANQQSDVAVRREH